MKLQELPFGIVSIVEFVLERGTVEALVPDSELELRRLPDEQVVLTAENHANAPPIAVRPKTEGLRRKLDELFTRNRPRVCRLAQVNRDTLLVQIHEFVSRHVWPEPLEVGLS